MSLLLQTYGIVQEEGQVEYMTFVLSVEEDGPAYMAGLRPGKSFTPVDLKVLAEPLASSNLTFRINMLERLQNTRPNQSSSTLLLPYSAVRSRLAVDE